MLVLKFELAGRYRMILARVRSGQEDKIRRQTLLEIRVLLVRKSGVSMPLRRLIYVSLATIYSSMEIASRTATRSRKNRLLPMRPWAWPILSVEGACPSARSFALRSSRTRIHRTLMALCRFPTPFNWLRARLLISQGVISHISFYEKQDIN